MFAAVVVIAGDQDAGLTTRLLAIEIRGDEPADAASNDDEVIGFGTGRRLGCCVPECVIA